MHVDFDKIFASQSDQVVTFEFSGEALYVLVGRGLLERVEDADPPVFLAGAKLGREWGCCGYEQQGNRIVNGSTPFKYGRWSVCEYPELLEENIELIRSRFFEPGTLVTFHGLVTLKKESKPMLLTPIQLQMARRLATTYGHLWADLTFSSEKSYSEEDIRKEVLQKHGVPVGREVMAPELDPFGTVVFSDEEVEWRVERNGWTYFQVGESTYLSCDPQGFHSWSVEMELNPGDEKSTEQVLTVARNLCVIPSQKGGSL